MKMIYFSLVLLVTTFAVRGSSFRADIAECSYKIPENQHQATKAEVHPQINGYNYQQPNAVGKSLAQASPLANDLTSYFVPGTTTHVAPSKISGGTPVASSNNKISYDNQPLLLKSSQPDEPLQTNGFNYQNVFLTPEQYYFYQKYSKLPEFIKQESSLYSGQQSQHKYELKSSASNGFSQQSQAVSFGSDSNRVPPQLSSNIATNAKLASAHNHTFDYATNKPNTNSPDFLSKTAFINTDNPLYSQRYSQHPGVHSFVPVSPPTQSATKSIFQPQQVSSSFQTVTQQAYANFEHDSNQNYNKGSTKLVSQTPQSNGYTRVLDELSHPVASGFVSQNLDVRSASPLASYYGTEGLQQPKAQTYIAPSRNAFGFQPLSNAKSLSFAANYEPVNSVNSVDSTDYIQKMSDSFELPTISFFTHSTPANSADKAPTPTRNQSQRQTSQQIPIQKLPIFTSQPSQYFSPNTADESHQLQEQKFSQSHNVQPTSGERSIGFATPITASRFFSIRVPHKVYGIPPTGTNSLKPITENK